MRAVLTAAEGGGWVLVALLGEPEYYGRFGFVASSVHGIEPPDPAWGPYFQVRVLAATPPPDVSGTFRYAEPFTRL